MSYEDPELRRAVETRILASAKDRDGFLSDAYVDDVTETYIRVDGLLDVQHLVSEVLLAVALNDKRRDVKRNGW